MQLAPSVTMRGRTPAGRVGADGAERAGDVAVLGRGCGTGRRRLLVWWVAAVLLAGCGRPDAASGAGDPLDTPGGGAEWFDGTGSGAGGGWFEDAGSGAVDGFGIADPRRDAGDAAGAVAAAGGAGDGSAGGMPGAGSGVRDAAPEALAPGDGSAGGMPGRGVGAVAVGRAAVSGDAAGPADGEDPSGDAGPDGVGGAREPGAGAEAPDGGSRPGSEAPGGDGAVADGPGPLRRALGNGAFFELGYLDGWPDRYDSEVFSDEVAVRLDSVLVDGDTVRGLVQNMSDRLFARHVTVSAGEGRWVFPLTVQPGEVAPFEIGGYQGPSDPESIGLEVSAQLTPEPDLRRSFRVSGLPGVWAGTWDHIEEVYRRFPHIVRPEGVSRGDRGHAYETSVTLQEPTSHPSVAGEAADLVVEDLRVYLTRLDDEDRVLDVSELTPYAQVTGNDGRRRVVPARRADRENRHRLVVFLPTPGSTYGRFNLGITVGGAHDGAEGADGPDGSPRPGSEAPGGDGAAADLPGPLRKAQPWSIIEFGYSDHWPDRYDSDVFSDEVAVRLDSVLVDGDTVRGLVQNMSDRLFARHVTVSAGEGRWVFPLTVQPGEVAPFEIGGYQGPSDPESIGLEVSAQLTPEPDLRRSFWVENSPGFWADTWDQVEHVLGWYPHIVRPEGVSRDDWVQAYETLIRLEEPTSHPSVAGEVADLVVEDLRVYLTRLDDEDRVLDVSELTPYIETTRDDGTYGPVQVHRIGLDSSFLVVFLPNYEYHDFAITVGGVHDGAG